LQIPLTAICRRVAPRATVTVGGKPDSIYQAQSFGSTISHSGESFAYAGFEEQEQREGNAGQNEIEFYQTSRLMTKVRALIFNES